MEVVFKVDPAVKALLEKTAKDLGISMNAAAVLAKKTGGAVERTAPPVA